jgi:hypothetical protein
VSSPLSIHDAAAARRVRHLLRLGRGRGTEILLVSGQSGSGRTTLLEQSVRRAADEGFRVLSTALAPICAGRPFGAAADLLRPLAGDGPLAGRPVLTHRLDALDRLYGGPTRRPLTPLTDRTAERERLFTAARQLLRRACAREPVLLVIDDVQYADPSSIALLRHIVVQPAGLPLRVIVGVSTGRDVAAFDTLGAVDGRPSPLVDHVELRRRSGGPPMQTLAEQLVDGLDEGARAVLQLFGAAGGLLENSVLATACPPATAVQALATLRSAGLVGRANLVSRAVPGAIADRARSWTVADAAYRRLSRARQRELHLCLLRTAERLAPAETAVPAYHAARAGDLLSADERLAVLVQHALSAADCYADATAVLAAEAALVATASASEAVAKAVQPELLDLRAEVLAATGHPGEAIDSWRAAAELALGGRSPAAARRLRRLAETEWATGRGEVAGVYADRAAAALPVTPPGPEHLAVQALRARIRSRLAGGDVDDVLAPLAELWRRTGWRGAEVEYKLALETLRPELGHPRRKHRHAQPRNIETASTSITPADIDETAS